MVRVIFENHSMDRGLNQNQASQGPLTHFEFQFCNTQLRFKKPTVPNTFKPRLFFLAAKPGGKDQLITSGGGGTGLPTPPLV
jgi:hypothetical protein